MGPRGHTVVGSCFLLYAVSGQPGFRGLTRVYTGSSWPWSGPWISPDAHPFRTLFGVGRRGCLPGSLRLTALLGAESAHPSLDVQLVLELHVGPRLPGPGLFPADEAVGLVAADGDIVGSVVLLCKRPPHAPETPVMRNASPGPRRGDPFLPSRQEQELPISPGGGSRFRACNNSSGSKGCCWLSPGASIQTWERVFFQMLQKGTTISDLQNPGTKHFRSLQLPSLWSLVIASPGTSTQMPTQILSRQTNRCF